MSLIPPSADETKIAATPLEEETESQNPPSPPPPPAAFALQAPMRLNPVLRDALTDAIGTLNEGRGPPVVCTVAQGVFVPLAELERRDVQPSLAMRALAEAGMLVQPGRDGPPTLTRDFNGSPAIGLVIDPRFVSGLDLAGFVTSATEPG